MKKLSLVLLIVFIIGLSGCTNLEIASVSTNTSTKMSSSYYYKNGTQEQSIKVKEGKTLNITADIKTKKGKLDAFIYKDKDNYNYKGKDIPTSKFTVTLSEPGEYTLKVVAHKHRGSYSFKW